MDKFVEFNMSEIVAGEIFFLYYIIFLASYIPRKVFEPLISAIFWYAKDMETSELLHT